MRTYLLSASLLLAMGTSGFAADLGAAMPAKAPVAPMMAAAYNWTGLYIGVNGGGGWNTWTGTSGAAGPGINSFSGSGGLVGGTFGGNYQIDHIVLGLEGTYDWADVSNTQIGPLGAGLLTLTTKNDYVATVAGRVGYAFDRVLVYGKGGVAFTRDNLNANVGAPVPGTAVGAFDRTGWLAGAGVECAFYGNWSVKAEYDYMGFGSINEANFTTTGGLAVAPATVKLNLQTATFGVNYKF